MGRSALWLRSHPSATSLVGWRERVIFRVGATQDLLALNEGLAAIILQTERQLRSTGAGWPEKIGSKLVTIRAILER